jgi:hypothetical protein
VSTLVEVVALLAAVVGVFIAVPRWAMPGWLRRQVASAASSRRDSNG